MRALGHGFLRIEGMKMEMARELEAMRMDTEMKHTEMILEFHQQIIEALQVPFRRIRTRRSKGGARRALRNNILICRLSICFREILLSCG